MIGTPLETAALSCWLELAPLAPPITPLPQFKVPNVYGNVPLPVTLVVITSALEVVTTASVALGMPLGFQLDALPQGPSLALVQTLWA